MQLLKEYSDEKIVHLARTRNPEYFGDLIARYQQRIFGFVLSIVNHPQTAEDIAQTSFEKAFKALHSFNVEKSFKTWIFTIAKNETYTYLRKRKKEKKYEHQPTDREIQLEIPSTAKNPAEHVQQNQDTKLVQRALRSLKPQYRAVLHFYYLKDYSYQQIAELLDLRLNTVRTHLRRAKQALAKEIKKLSSETFKEY